MDDASELLLEIQRQSERVIDHQLRASEELDRKLEHLSTLGVASVGGGFAIGAFLTTQAEPSAVQFAPLLVGVLLNVVAIAYFMRGYGSLKESIEIGAGPDPSWLAEKAREPGQPMGSHVLVVIRGLAQAFEENRQVVAFVSAQRKKGARLLLGGVGFYVITASVVVIRWVFQ